jgi:hypothetical protein
MYFCFPQSADIFIELLLKHLFYKKYKLSKFYLNKAPVKSGRFCFVIFRMFQILYAFAMTTLKKQK